MNESKITGNDSSFLKTLAKAHCGAARRTRILRRFEDDLERWRPLNKMTQEKRQQEIQSFAEISKLDYDNSRGWVQYSGNISESRNPGAVD